MSQVNAERQAVQLLPHAQPKERPPRPTSDSKKDRPLPPKGQCDQFEDDDGETCIWFDDASRWINKQLKDVRRAPGRGKAFKIGRAALQSYCSAEEHQVGCILLGRTPIPRKGWVDNPKSRRGVIERSSSRVSVGRLLSGTLSAA